MRDDVLSVPRPSTSSTKRNWFAGLALFAITVALGFVYALLVIGPRVVDPRDLSWLTRDPATSYIGWGFFRLENHLRLPLGWSGMVGYPFGTPAAYFDSIPLAATAFWLVRGLLPEHFQYLGLYFCLCASLQFYYGFRISRRIFDGDRVAALIGAAFFLTAPIFTFRAFGHFALASQWVLLAAIDQFLSAAKRPSASLIACNGLLCFIAGAINPYIAAMALLISWGAYLRAPLLRRSGLGLMAIGMSVSSLAALCAMLLFGFLRTDDISQYTGAGYGTYSMNLLAPLDPGLGPLFTHKSSILLPALPRTNFQYEGFNYLGLGILLLCVTGLAISRRRLVQVRGRTLLPALAICVISLLLALSDRATVGNDVIYQVHLPRLLLAALTAFRASGRLFWPAYYLIFTGVLTLSAWSFQRKRLHVVLAATLIIQLVDISPLCAALHAQWRHAQAAAVPSGPDWDRLGGMQKHLVVLPAWQCSDTQTPGGGENGYAIFGRLAIQQDMTLNSFYAGRYSDEQLQYFCDAQPMQIEQHGLQPDTAYVFAADRPGMVAGLDTDGAYCRIVGPYILCSHVPGHTGVDPALPKVPLLQSGQVVSFIGSAQPAQDMLGRGWSVPEAWGRWMIGLSSSLIFRVNPAQHADMQFTLDVVPFVRANHPDQRVAIMANGHMVARTIFRRPASQLKLTVPAGDIGGDGVLRLTFLCADPASPFSLGSGDDGRELTIGLVRLALDSHVATERSP